MTGRRGVRSPLTPAQVVAREELEALFITLETLFSELCKNDGPEWDETEFRTAAICHERLRVACRDSAALLAERARLGLIVDVLCIMFQRLADPDDVEWSRTMVLNLWLVGDVTDMARDWGIE